MQLFEAYLGAATTGRVGVRQLMWKVWARR
jgi:hypothetical protein